MSSDLRTTFFDHHHVSWRPDGESDPDRSCKWCGRPFTAVEPAWLVVDYPREKYDGACVVCEPLTLADLPNNLAGVDLRNISLVGIWRGATP